MIIGEIIKENIKLIDFYILKTKINVLESLGVPNVVEQITNNVINEVENIFKNKIKNYEIKLNGEFSDWAIIFNIVNSSLHGKPKAVTYRDYKKVYVYVSLNDGFNKELYANYISHELMHIYQIYNR